MKTKTRKYRSLIIEQRTSADTPVSLESWRHITTVYDSAKPNAVLRAYHYRIALNEGTLMLGIWGENHPIRIRAQHSRGEDTLSLADVERIGRTLHAIENEG